MQAQALTRGTARWVPSSAPSSSQALRCGGRSRRSSCVQCSAAGGAKKRLLFLGTPDVAASVLRHIIYEAQEPDASFELVGVISQPGKPKGRGNKATPVPSPVEETARAWKKMPKDAVLTPATAKDPEFLEQVRAMKPDLCVTAAYGNILPQAFLDIPPLGTLNIHPSLLPKYRGAAPVQRALQAGEKVTGVSVAYTVLKCDAGPVLVQEKVAVDPEIQAPDLLQHLFDVGSQALIRSLPAVWAGKGPSMAVAQDDSAVVHAAKLTKEEGVLDPANASSAQALHDTVRGFAGWPGTVVRLSLVDEASGAAEPMELRVIQTQTPNDADAAAYAALSLSNPLEVGWSADGDMLLPCQGGKGGVLRVQVVQPPTKKALPAKDFRNGVRKKRIVLVPQK